MTASASISGPSTGITGVGLGMAVGVGIGVSTGEGAGVAVSVGAGDGMRAKAIVGVGEGEDSGDAILVGVGNGGGVGLNEGVTVDGVFVRVDAGATLRVGTDDRVGVVVCVAANVGSAVDNGVITALGMPSPPPPQPTNTRIITRTINFIRANLSARLTRIDSPPPKLQAHTIAQLYVIN